MNIALKTAFFSKNILATHRRAVFLFFRRISYIALNISPYGFMAFVYKGLALTI
jgi:hypothetical protein